MYPVKREHAPLPFVCDSIHASESPALPCAADALLIEAPARQASELGFHDIKSSLACVEGLGRVGGEGRLFGRAI
jgi:hypothetical protein